MLFYTVVALHCFIGVQLICNLRISVTPIKHIKKLKEEEQQKRDSDQAVCSHSLLIWQASLWLWSMRALAQRRLLPPGVWLDQSPSPSISKEPLSLPYRPSWPAPIPPSAEPLACNARVQNILHLKHRERGGCMIVSPPPFSQKFLALSQGAGMKCRNPGTKWM